RGYIVGEQHSGQRRWPHAATTEAAAQRRPSLVQPPPHRVLAPAELFGGFFACPAFQVAENQWQPPLVWQLPEFGIEDCEQFCSARVTRPFGLGQRGPLLMTVAAGCSPFGLEGHAVGNPVQPAR